MSPAPATTARPPPGWARNRSRLRDPGSEAGTTTRDDLRSPNIALVQTLPDAQLIMAVTMIATNTARIRTTE